MYRLEVGEEFYIGSTTQTLQKRLNHHRDNSKVKPGRFFDAIRAVGKDKLKILLLEELEITCRKELLEKEKWYLSQADKTKCLNTINPVRTSEEKRIQARAAGKKWYDANKKAPERVLKSADPDYNKKRWKEWADKNREYLRERYKEYDALRDRS